jgi:hypothetical protein
MVRYFFLSLNVLNSLLALAVAAVAYFAVIPLLNPVARISLPAVKETATPSEEQTTPSQRSPVTDYAVISDKNLFHPERKLPLEKQPEKAVPKPDVVLYGTLIGDDASYAFIEDKKAPYSTPGRGKRQITLKKGDHLSGYIVSEIEANRIVLVKGEEKLVVMLDDGAKRRTSEAPAGPTAARTAAAGTSTPSPQAMPPSLPAAVSPVPGIAPPGSRPPAPAASSPGPGIGASDTRTPTESEIEQMRQRVQERREIQARQRQRSQGLNATPQ